MGAQSKQAPLPPWGFAVAGAAGAVLANTLVYPLDLVKTKLQVQVKRNPNSKDSAVAPDGHHYDSTWDAISQIYGEEGLAGLYAGMTGCLVGVASTNFAYFYWYTVVRTFYLTYRKTGVAPSTAVELSLGAVAGALAQLFTIPVAVVTTRQQTVPKSERKGLLATAKDVIDSEDGWTGLWRGLKASLVLVVNPSITYGAYQRLRVMMFPNKANLAPWESFLLGAMSKALATVATQPLIVAKVGLQSNPPPQRKGKPFKTFGEVLKFIIEHEGPLSLFKGIGPQLLKGILVQGILMMSKERTEVFFILLYRMIKEARTEKLKALAVQAQQNVKSVAPVVLK